ncbi:hypothetical protein KPF69_12530 [Acinetobacter baumannii]|nr:hypothetical protein [Acinetobacter baumannii]HCQ9872900.1 hypothetical protein [Acinetobacter baumannii]
MMKKLLFFVFLTLCFNTTLFAAEGVEGRKIIDIGCHADSGTCYVSLSGNPFGSTLGCPVSNTNEFRFDNAETPHGKRAYASLLAAFLAKKTVDIYLAGCTSQGHPNLIFFHIR